MSFGLFKRGGRSIFRTSANGKGIDFRVSLTQFSIALRPVSLRQDLTGEFKCDQNRWSALNGKTGQTHAKINKRYFGVDPMSEAGDIKLDIKPIIAESSTSESKTVEVVLNDLKEGIVTIPDYQRDSDQWDEQTKSILIESVINNLSIPAFFFEVEIKQGVEYDLVIDGQQRLTTLNKFFWENFLS
jgi:hypothetical protein